MITVKQVGEVIEVRGCTQTWVQKALDHWAYLRDYRKGYSKRKSAKATAVKRAAMAKGINVAEVEAQAILELKRKL